MSTPEPLLPPKRVGGEGEEEEGEQQRQQRRGGGGGRSVGITGGGEVENEVTGVPASTRRYVVTGDRRITTILTVRDDGTWELEEGTLYDVTHLPCRSAAYRSGSGGGGGGDGDGDEKKNATCLPGNANLKDFPVRPGAEMPKIEGCEKQDYAVLFVLGEVV